VEGKIIQSRSRWQSRKVEKRAAEDWEFLKKRPHPLLLLPHPHIYFDKRLNRYCYSYLFSSFICLHFLVFVFHYFASLVCQWLHKSWALLLPPPPHIYFDKTFNLYCFSHWFSSSCFLHFLVFVFSFVASLVCLWLNNSWGWGPKELLRWSHTAWWSNMSRCWCQVVDVIIWHSFGYKRQKTKVCKNRQPRFRYTVALIMWAVGCAGGPARMSQKFPSAAKLLAADASKKAEEED
jgi:hypothetical protein